MHGILLVLMTFVCAAASEHCAASEPVTPAQRGLRSIPCDDQLLFGQINHTPQVLVCMVLWWRNKLIYSFQLVQLFT